MTQVAHETLCFPTVIEPAVEVYRDPYTVISRRVARFDGFTKEYFCWDRGVRAAILPVSSGHILLTRQYRFNANRISLEIAGGAVEKGERPVDAAVRECEEETGIRCLDPMPLISFEPDLDTYQNPTFIFFSERQEGGQDAESERFVWVPLEDAERRVFAGEINDALSVIGIMALAGRARR